MGFLHSWDEPIARRAVAGLLLARRPFTAMRFINIHGDTQAERLHCGGA